MPVLASGGGAIVPYVSNPQSKYWRRCAAIVTPNLYVLTYCTIHCTLRLNIRVMK